MGIIIEIFQELGEVPVCQKSFKISKSNCFVQRGRLKIIEYKISSSPGDVGEDKEMACSSSSIEKGRLYVSVFRLTGGTIVVEFLIFLKAGE